MTKKQLFIAAAQHRHCIVHPDHESMRIRNMRSGVEIKFWDAGGQHRSDVRLDLARAMTLSEAARALNLT